MFKLDYTFVSSRHLVHCERFFANSDISVSSIMNRIYLCVLGIMVLLMDVDIFELFCSSFSTFSNCSSDLYIISNYSDIVTVIFVMYFLFTVLSHCIENSLKVLVVASSSFNIILLHSLNTVPVICKYLICLLSGYRDSFFVTLKVAIFLFIASCFMYYIVFVFIGTSESYVIGHYFNRSLTYGSAFNGRTYYNTIYRFMVLSHANELFGFNHFSPLDMGTNSVIIYVYLYVFIIKYFLYFLFVVCIYLYCMFGTLWQVCGTFKFYNYINSITCTTYVFIRYYFFVVCVPYKTRFINYMFMLFCAAFFFIYSYNLQFMYLVYDLYLLDISYWFSRIDLVSSSNIIFDFLYSFDIYMLYTKNIIGNFICSGTWPVFGPVGFVSYKGLGGTIVTEILPRTFIYTHIDIYEADCGFNSFFRFLKCLLGFTGTYLTYGFGSYIFEDNLWPNIKYGTGLSNILIGGGNYIIETIYGSGSHYYFDSLNVWYNINIGVLLNNNPVFGDNKYSWCHDICPLDFNRSGYNYKLY